MRGTPSLRLGICPSIQESVRRLGTPFSLRWEGGLKEPIDRCAMAWPLGGEMGTSVGQRVESYEPTTTVLP